LPEHYSKQIDFEQRLGKYVKETEPKLAYCFNDELKTFEFIFKKSFNEMIEEFRKYHHELFENGKKIPFDWTIYYLRKKALTQKIEKEELAWLLLNFNQKRGYYQLRGEDDEMQINKKEYVIFLRVTDIQEGELDKKNDKKRWYTFYFENGWTYSASFTAKPEWINSEREFLVTEELDEDGNIKIIKDKIKDKAGKESRKITPLPSFEEIDLMPKDQQNKIYKKIKARTEFTIINSGKTVGTYIYDILLQNPKQKINGGLVRVIERKFYKSELKTILEVQQKFHPELQNKALYKQCLDELYKYNEAHKTSNEEKDFVNLFLNDIIFYQRPLKSKKSLISDCKFESRPMRDKQGKLQKNIDGSQVMKPLKCIAKSHPLFQEFRLWQWLKNLSIYEKSSDKDVTEQFFTSEEDWVHLFDWLNNRKEVNHKDLLNFLCKPLKLKPSNYRWNYVYDSVKDESKKYPCNKTRHLIISKLGEEKCKDFLTQENELKIWELLYSLNTKEETEKALSENAHRENKKNRHK